MVQTSLMFVFLLLAMVLAQAPYHRVPGYSWLFGRFEVAMKLLLADGLAAEPSGLKPLQLDGGQLAKDVNDLALQASCSFYVFALPLPLSHLTPAPLAFSSIHALLLCHGPRSLRSTAATRFCNVRPLPSG